MAYRVFWVINRYLFSLDVNFPRINGIGAKNCPGGFGSAGTQEARESEDFPLMKAETDIPDFSALIEIANFQNYLVLFRIPMGMNLFVNFPTHHLGYNLFNGDILHGCGGYIMAIPHDGYPIGDLL